jgi:methyl-accepting chemotaxis protein
MRLQTRLLIGIGGIVTGLGLTIVFLAVILSRTVGQYEHLLHSEKQLAMGAMDCYIAVLQARRHEKDFLLRLKPDDVAKHGEVIAKLRSELDELRALPLQDVALPVAEDAQPQAVGTVLTTLQPSIDAYAAAFAALVEANQQRGLNAEEGIQKTFREAVHGLEKSLGNDEPRVTVQLLQVRRSEKDYQLRLRTDSEKYRSKTLAEVDKLQALIATLPAASQAGALAAVGTYRDGFLKLVELDGRIAATEETMRAAIRQVESEVTTLHDGAETLSELRASATESAAQTWTLAALIVGGSGIVLAFIFVSMQAKKIASPIAATAASLRRMADGDFRERLESSRQDEIGDMTRALDSTMGALRLAINNVAAEATKVAKEAQEITQVSDHVAHAATSNSAEAQTVASSTEEVSASTTTVAASAEEMLAAIGEISRNVQEATTIARDADGKSGSARQEMLELSKASSEIGSVVQIIRGIAEQTNLLALNATIEAARAGEAGRGFAVVASEVKTLASQTAAATVRIEEMVAGIQRRADGANVTMGSIADVVRRIADVQASIASAVEEQSATSQEITRAVGDVSPG